jgi:hypothetical protein
MTNEEMEARIGRTRDLSPGWDSYDAPIPTDEARATARRVLAAMIGRGMDCQRIVPSCEGGIGFIWAHGDVRADIECYNDGDYLAGLYGKKDKEISILEASIGLPEILSSIEGHLALNAGIKP